MKKFLIVGNMNAITYKGVFPLIKDNQLWLGRSWIKEFIQTDGIAKSFGNICWYTNLEHNKCCEPLELYKRYTPEEYPHYDNYDAIEVSRVVDIPMDYDGLMGVPITFLAKWCPEQFEIVGLNAYVEDNPHCGHRFTLNGKETYVRILIRHK